jgi:hypothetical protein
LAVQEIVEAIYAPHKAFKKIVQNPKFLAPLIVVVLFVAVQVGSAYIIGTRSFLEQTMPTGQQGDVWTEVASYWQASSGVTISENHVDYINSSVQYFNTTSIEFKADSANGVQLFLNDFGESVNCGPNGFRNLSIRVKIDSPSSVPINATLYLYSLGPTNCFTYDLSQAFSNVTIVAQHLWNNITVPVETGWSTMGSPDWQNITGLRMDFAWTEASSVDLKVDGLFFRGVFKGLLDINASSVLINAALNSTTPFLFEWLLLTGLIYLLIKGLRGNVVWKPVMVAVGVALVVLVVQYFVLTGVYSAMLPDVYYPLEIVAYIPGESEAAAQVIQSDLASVFQIGSYLQIAIWVWLFGLGTFITRAVTGIAPANPLGSTEVESERTASFQTFSWPKCMLVSAASLVLTITILGFLGLG